MYFQYPLEAVARKRGLASQFEFAMEARRHLPDDSDETLCEPNHHGLVILAADEAALTRPLGILRQVYGDWVRVNGPKVRYLPGHPPQLPMMQARIAVRREFELKVLAELRRRGARVVERCERSGIFTVKADAPMECLLGLPAWLDDLTGRSATHSIRLQGYTPSPLGPAA